MELEEKRKLLTSDLMSRANYWIDLKVDYKGKTYTLFGYGAGRVSLLANPFMSHVEGVSPLIEEVKPYLRSLSSMTEEEYNEFFNYYHTIEEEFLKNSNYTDYFGAAYASDNAKYDWLNKHHFDYRELIKLGLALEAPKGMYND